MVKLSPMFVKSVISHCTLITQKTRNPLIYRKACPREARTRGNVINDNGGSRTSRPTWT